MWTLRHTSQTNVWFRFSFYFIFFCGRVKILAMLLTVSVVTTSHFNSQGCRKQPVTIKVKCPLTHTHTQTHKDIIINRPHSSPFFLFRSIWKIYQLSIGEMQSHATPAWRVRPIATLPVISVHERQASLSPGERQQRQGSLCRFEGSNSFWLHTHTHTHTNIYTDKQTMRRRGRVTTTSVCNYLHNGHFTTKKTRYTCVDRMGGNCWP